MAEAFLLPAYLPAGIPLRIQWASSLHGTVLVSVSEVGEIQGIHHAHYRSGSTLNKHHGFPWTGKMEMYMERGGVGSGPCDYTHGSVHMYRRDLHSTGAGTAHGPMDASCRGKTLHFLCCAPWCLSSIF